MQRQLKMESLRRYGMPALVVMLLAAGLVQVGFEPIYPDEIAYKIFLERYFINGGFKQSVTPFCADFLVRPPIALLPAAWFWSFISHLGNGWISYRLVPFAGLGISLFVLIRTNLQRGIHYCWPLLLFLTLGPWLYGFLLLRPEIIIVTAGLLIYALADKMLRLQNYHFVLLAAAGCLLIYDLAVYLHPKVLYLSVLVAVVAITTASQFQLKRQRFVYVGTFLTIVAVITIAALQLHQKEFLQCRSTPKIEEIIQNGMSAQAVNPIDLLLNPHRFIEDAHKLLDGSLYRKARHAVYYFTSYEVNFLPPQQILSISDTIADRLILFITSIYIFYILGKTWISYRCMDDATEHRRLCVVTSLMFGLFTPYLLNLTKHFYEEAFFMASLLTSVTLLYSFHPQRPQKQQRHLPSLFAYILVFSSILCLYRTWHDITQPLLNGYEGPSLSLKIDRAKIKDEIEKALSGSGISMNANLVVDDATYDAVKFHPVLLPATYLSMVADNEATVSYYAKLYHADYGVIRCSFMDFPLKKIADVEVIAILDYHLPTATKYEKADNICLFRFK